MSYKVNYLLLEQLPQLYPSGYTAFYRDCGIPDSTWWRWIKNKRFRLTRIIDLCNKLFIPFEYFISEEENIDVIPTTDELFRAESEFDKVNFNFDLFTHTITGKRCIKELASRTRIGRTTLYMWLRDKEKGDTTMECLVHACNLLNSKFSDFISVQDDDKTTTTAIDKLRTHNRRLSLKVKKLTDENEQLKKDKERLFALFEKHVASCPTMVADNENSNYKV